MEIVLSFVGVFIGAFLAIGLENYRERRVTRRWVWEHLGHLTGQLEAERPRADEIRSLFAALQGSLDQWMAAEDAVSLDDETWERLGETVSRAPFDFGHLLRSEALGVLPKSLAAAIADVEYCLGLLDLSLARTRETFTRDVLPLWYERQAPLSRGDKRRLRAYQNSLASLREEEVSTVEAIDRMLVEYHRSKPRSLGKGG